MTTRDEQKQATRAHILAVATDLLVERGYRAFTTVAVQQAAGLSRGALLHHFPTIQDLSEALVAHLVALNEMATQSTAARIGSSADTIDRTLTALYESMTQSPAQAEFELWAAARTDPVLAEVLRKAEGKAGRDLNRVIGALFGPDIVAHPSYPAIRELTVAIVRGVAISRPLRSSKRTDTSALDHWADAIRVLLSSD